MLEMRTPRRRVAGERARTGRPSPYPVTQTSTPPDSVVVDRAAPAPVDERPEPTTVDRADHPAGTAPRGWPFLLTAALVALLVAGLATAGVLFFRVQEADAASSARREAVAAARSHAQAVLSYDYQRLDAGFARAEKVLTGTFKRDYARTTSTVVRPSAEQYKVVVKAEVTAASVIQATPERAVVLLFVDQTTTSTRLDGPKVDLNRVRMTLVKQDGNWLVSGVDAL